MQYQVPQFIEIEDKIFGPLTLKQFLYLAGGAGICLILFTFLPLFLVVILGIPVMAFAAALAFYEVNGRPFIEAVEHAVGYFFGSKLYLWKQREARAAAAKAAAPKAAVQLPVPKLSESKLKDLAWSLNIKDRQQAEEGRRNGFEI
jgi:hypothetical protein